MKKIAFYVEGQTEQLFLKRLIVEIAGQKNIAVELQRFQGKYKPKKQITPTSQLNANPDHYVLLYDCMGDESVKSRILEDKESLFNSGYEEIIGLRDLYDFQLNNLNRLKTTLNDGVTRNGKVIIPPLPKNATIIIAVREIEDWFLKECSHFKCVDKSIILNSEQITQLGFNPCEDNLTKRSSSAVEDLNAVYQLANKSYSKSKKRLENNTLNCLDYAIIYLRLRDNLPDLKELIDKIDNFLS